MDRLGALPEALRARVRLLPFHHTNPALSPGAPERDVIEAGGFRLVAELERVAL